MELTSIGVVTGPWMPSLPYLLFQKRIWWRIKATNIKWELSDSRATQIQCVGDESYQRLATSFTRWQTRYHAGKRFAWLAIHLHQFRLVLDQSINSCDSWLCILFTDGFAHISQVWFRVNEQLPEGLQKSLPDRPPETHSSELHEGLTFYFPYDSTLAWLNMNFSTEQQLNYYWWVGLIWTQKRMLLLHVLTKIRNLRF